MSTHYSKQGPEVNNNPYTHTHVRAHFKNYLCFILYVFLGSIPDGVTGIFH